MISAGFARDVLLKRELQIRNLTAIAPIWPPPQPSPTEDLYGIDQAVSTENLFQSNC
jgi:hypothetical protein